MMTLTRLLVLTAVVVFAVPQAHAQMGSVNNPPSQRLFNMDQPQRLDNGLGTMAERRARLAQVKRTQKPVRR